MLGAWSGGRCNRSLVALALLAAASRATAFTHLRQPLQPPLHPPALLHQRHSFKQWPVRLAMGEREHGEVRMSQRRLCASYPLSRLNTRAAPRWRQLLLAFSRLRQRAATAHPSGVSNGVSRPGVAVGGAPRALRLVLLSALVWTLTVCFRQGIALATGGGGAPVISPSAPPLTQRQVEKHGSSPATPPPPPHLTPP